MDLEIKIQEAKPHNFTVILKGRLDSETHRLFDDRIKLLHEKKAKNVLINMAGVSYISSAGLGSIFQLMKKTRENGGELLLCNLQPQIKKVFEIIKALPTTSIFASIEEADKYLDVIMKNELEGDKGHAA